MIKILFVCTGNTCRSVMAEKICNHFAKKNKLKIKAESAGIFANVNQPISQGAINALKKCKIRNLKHKATQFCLDNLYNYDYCIAVTQDIKNYIGKFENVYCFSDLVIGANDIVDPYNQNQTTYNNSCEQIKKYIEILLNTFGENK